MSRTLIVTARNAVAEVARHLREANDLADMTVEEVERARFEVELLERAPACEGVRVSWLWALATNTLRSIAVAGASGVVGDLAIEAIKAVKRYLS